MDQPPHNIMDTKEYKGFVFSIPEKVCFEGFRFIRVVPKGKNPIDANYLQTNNFSHDSLTIQRHLRRKGNIGVIPVNGYCILDADKFEVFEELGIAHYFEDTFTVKTGGEGEKYHFYIKCPEMHGKFPLYNPNTGDHIGDFYGAGQKGFCVAPPSIHPSGIPYTVVHDTDIKEFDLDILESILSPLRKKLHPTQTRLPPKYDYDQFSRDHDIMDILPPDNPVKQGTEYQGAHPVHGSTGGKNYSVDTYKNVWFCFRCNSGGNWIHALLMKHGYIECGECVPGSLQNRGYEIREACELEGLETPQFTRIGKKPVATGDIEIQKVAMLPDKLPSCDALLIQAYPRTGKTHKVVAHLVTERSGAFISARHSVLEHALNIFKHIREEGQTAAHIGGKDKVCKFEQDCFDCEYNIVYKEDGIHQTKAELDEFIRDLVEREPILTGDILHNYNVCPYQGLLSARNHVDFIFAVPYFLTTQQPDKALPPQSLIILDEDITIAGLYPNELTLAEVTIGRGIMNMRALLGSVSETHLNEFKTMISDPEINKNPSKKRDNQIIRVINGVIKWVTYINRAADYKKEELKSRLVAELESVEYLDDIEFNQKEKLVEKIHDYIMSFPVQHKETIEKLCTGFIYNNHLRRFQWIGKMRSTLFAIPERRIFTFTPFEKMIIIGQTAGELFINDLHRQHDLQDCRILNCEAFRYINNFVFYVIEGASTTKMKRILHGIINENRKRRGLKTPVLIATPTKEKQLDLKQTLGAGAIISSNEDLYEQLENHHSGRANIVYLNSVVSRGLDVDFYDIMFIVGSDFQTPYFMAMREHAVDMGDDEKAKEYNYIMDRIKYDEVINMCLRVAPIGGREDDLIKLVILPSSIWGYFEKYNFRARNQKIQTENAQKIIRGIMQMRNAGSRGKLSGIAQSEHIMGR